MLVELCRTHKFASTQTDEIVQKMDVIKMISSSRWEINNQPSAITPFFIFLIVAIFAVLSIVIITYKLVKKHAPLRCHENSKLEINMPCNTFA